MDILVELLPQSGLVRLGDTFHPCVAGPAGHLTVHGHELRPLTLAECELISVYAGDGGPDSSAALALRMASDSASPDDDGAGSFRSSSPGVRFAVEAVALFLAGATGTGSLRGTGVLLTRHLGLPLAQTLGLTVLAADALAPALPETPPPVRRDDGWTTYEIATPQQLQDPRQEAVPPDEPEPEAEVRRVRDLLAARFTHRLTSGAAAWEPADHHPAEWSPDAPEPGLGPRTALARDRWGAPVETAVPAFRPDPAEYPDAALGTGAPFQPPAARAMDGGTPLPPQGRGAGGDAPTAIRPGSTSGAAGGSQPLGRAHPSLPVAFSPDALHPGGFAAAPPAAGGVSPRLAGTGPDMPGPGPGPDRPWSGDPRTPQATPWDPAKSGHLAGERPLTWDAWWDPGPSTGREPYAEPPWALPPAGDRRTTPHAPAQREWADAVARVAASPTAPSEPGRASEPGWRPHQGPPPTDRPQQAEPGAGAEVDAVALQLAHDLHAIADLHGVPR